MKQTGHQQEGPSFSVPPAALQSSSSGSNGQSWAGSQCTAESQDHKVEFGRKGSNQKDNWAVPGYSFGSSASTHSFLHRFQLPTTIKWIVLSPNKMQPSFVQRHSQPLLKMRRCKLSMVIVSISGGQSPVHYQVALTTLFKRELHHLSIFFFLFVKVQFIRTKGHETWRLSMEEVNELKCPLTTYGMHFMKV